MPTDVLQLMSLLVLWIQQWYSANDGVKLKCLHWIWQGIFHPANSGMYSCSVNLITVANAVHFIVQAEVLMINNPSFSQCFSQHERVPIVSKTNKSLHIIVLLHLTRLEYRQSCVHRIKAAPWSWFSVVLFIINKAPAVAATLPVMPPT